MGADPLGRGPPLAVAVRTRQTVFFPDVAALLAAHPGLTEHADLPAMGASINLPLIVGGVVAGAIVLIWDQPQHLPDRQRAALQALARCTAQAVQRATLIRDRRTAAQVLQESLPTRLPRPDHLELGARYVPAAVGESVGGDRYDELVLRLHPQERPRPDQEVPADVQASPGRLP